MLKNLLQPVFIISPPRVASSFLTRALVAVGFVPFDGEGPIEMMPSQHNPNGYFEDVWLTLLNDKIIRMAYSVNDSFLHITGVSPRFDPNDWDANFAFDLSGKFVDFPNDYVERCRWYTGNDWDVWGLSRMQPGGKWHKAYSRNGLGSFSEVRNSISKFRDSISAAAANGEHLVIKDPRLALSLPALGIEGKVVMLSRNRDSHLKSMRSHYGPRMFSDETFPGFNWVSNHFNFKIRSQSIENYLQNYEAANDRIRTQHETFELTIDALTEERILELESFIGKRLPSLKASARL